MSSVIVDTGPLVAYLMRTDRWHNWAIREFDRIHPPFATCEPVLTETFFLVQQDAKGVSQFLQMLDRGILEVRFEIFPQRKFLTQLLFKYADMPMALADACLVRMSEIIDDSIVFTVDKHFQAYRRNGRQLIPLIHPGSGSSR